MCTSQETNSLGNIQFMNHEISGFGKKAVMTQIGIKTPSCDAQTAAAVLPKLPKGGSSPLGSSSSLRQTWLTLLTTWVSHAAHFYLIFLND